MVATTFFSPSFRSDLERFCLLRASINRFYEGNARHIVAVPRSDLNMFKNALGRDNVDVIEQNLFVRNYFYPKVWVTIAKKVFPSQAWRLGSFSGRTGWIIQQIVKLSLPEIVSDGAIAILDSDLVFVRRFDDASLFGADDSKRLLLRDEQQTESGKHREHIVRAREILGLPPGSTEHHYMGYPTIWYVDWITKLRSYIERTNGQDWQRVLFDAEVFSEYSLYGIYVEEILKPDNLICKKRFHHVVWDMHSYEAFMGDTAIPSPHESPEGAICILVQSNLGIPPAAYRAHFEQIWRVGNSTRG